MGLQQTLTNIVIIIIMVKKYSGLEPTITVRSVWGMQYTEISNQISDETT